MGDLDDLELFDIQDQAEIVGWLTPREYAKLRKMSPQLVYYYIRNKVIEVEPCRCGRPVLNVAQTDEALAEKARQRRKGLDTRTDAERGLGSDLQDLPPTDSLEQADD